MRFENTVDLARWAVVSYNDDTGLGRQGTDMRKVLGLGYHFILPSVKLQTRPPADQNEVVVPLDASENELRSILKEIQGIFILEKIAHHVRLAEVAKKEGVVVACVPNWEQFGGWFSSQNLGDLFLCPTRMTRRVLRFFGFRHAVQVTCPVDLDLLPERTPAGPARCFVHNGGVRNPLDDRKATREVIEAFKKVPRPDIRLIVRLQNQTELPPLDPRIEVRVGNLEAPGELYADGDVAIQPSKLEGIGLSVVEAALSGLPVITSDFPPMNEFITDKPLRCKVGKRFHLPAGYRGLYHVFLKKPDIDDLARRIAWCAENDLRPFARRNAALRQTLFAPAKVREEWQTVLQAYADGRLAEIEPRHLSLATPLFAASSLFFRTLRAGNAWRKRRSRSRPVAPRGKPYDREGAPLKTTAPNP